MVLTINKCHNFDLLTTDYSMKFSSLTLPRKLENGIISLSIICIWTFLVLLISLPEDEDAVDELSLAFYTYGTLFFGLFLGFIASVIRVIGVVKDTSHFFYIFTGVLNSCLGIFGIYLVLSNQQGLPWVLFFLFSFVMGFLIMMDILMKKSVAEH